MNNATPRSRKPPVRLITFFLALTGIFFITFFGIPLAKEKTSSSTSSEKATSSNLETITIIDKAAITELATTVKIEESGQKIIYLTFDDGPGPYTAKLLDVLKKYDTKATFFVTNAGDDDLIAREHNEGHTVALHSYTHNYSYIYSSVNNYFEDLYNVQARVKNITGDTTTLVRFPGGSSNLVSASYDGGSHIMSYLTSELTNRGFTYFDWNISSGDAGGTTSSEEVYENVINSLKPDFSIVLQHDIKEFSVNAVEDIIKYGKANGYTFKKLDKNSFTAHHGVNN